MFSPAFPLETVADPSVVLAAASAAACASAMSVALLALRMAAALREVSRRTSLRDFRFIDSVAQVDVATRALCLVSSLSVVMLN
jgi:hypothetical protein